MTTRLTFDGGWRATVTDDPLHFTPRFGYSVDLAPFANVERERFLADTFDSREWLWDTPDILRFDKAGRELVGAQFHWPDIEAPRNRWRRQPS
jgi:hypothetical protein